MSPFFLRRHFILLAAYPRLYKSQSPAVLSNLFEFTGKNR
jgi:hypothetical protein